jgi:hypothetical protein
MSNLVNKSKRPPANLSVIHEKTQECIESELSDEGVNYDENADPAETSDLVKPTNEAIQVKSRSALMSFFGLKGV